MSQGVPRETMREVFSVAAPADDDATGQSQRAVGLRYNVAPGEWVGLIRLDTASRRSLEALRWGLLCRALGEQPKPFINARSEGIERRGLFRSAFDTRRCLIPATGFYEWQRSTRQPFYFQPVAEDRRGLLALGGIWSRWSTQDGLCTFAILTTAANPDVSSFHDRMPVIIGQDGWSDWLAPGVRPSVRELMAPPRQGTLWSHPVSKRVNKAGVEGPELVIPVEPEVPL